jgi:ankyrin repeat protein
MWSGGPSVRDHHGKESMRRSPLHRSRLVGLTSGGLLVALVACLVGGPGCRRFRRPASLTDKVIHAAETGDLVMVALAVPHAEHASEKFFRSLLDYSPEVVLRKDGEGATLLHWAVKGSNEAMASTLLRMKADVNARNSAGETPLHVASHASALVVSRLIDAGADVGARDNSGRTPLHTVLAAAPIAALLARHADASLRDNEGKTPLHHVLLEKAALLLLDGGADVNAADNGGRTPLHLAVIRNRRGLAELLVSKGANVNARDKTGQTPLHCADRWHQFDLAVFLREHGASGKILDNDGRRAPYAEPIMVCTCNAFELKDSSRTAVGSRYVRLGESCGPDLCTQPNAFLR